MANQPSKYSKFLVGAASAALVASAVAPVASAADFKDTKGNTHEEAINALSDAGVIKGYSDGTFLPNKTLTRSDVVKMMGKWLVTEGHSIPSDARTNPRFTDLSTKSNGELLDYAAVVKDAGVFIGSNGKLLAVDNITRENMALVLVRAFDTVENIDLATYVAAQDFNRDVKDLTAAKSEARAAIDVLDFFDITNPAVATFNPKGNTTRGHFATFLHKTINADFSKVAGEAAEGVVSVKAVNATTVEVAYKEDAKDVNASNYTIEGLTVSNAAVKQTDNKTVVLTTSVQEGGKEYTVKAGESALGKFTGISDVIPTKITTDTTSLQGVVGKEVTLKADINVKQAGVPVTFNVKADDKLNKDQVVEAVTNAEGIATYSYTQYSAGNDDVAVYPTGAPSVRSLAKVYWGVDSILTIVADDKKGEEINNGENKVYKVTYKDAKTGKAVANQKLHVTFAENVDTTIDKITHATANGKTAYQLTNGKTEFVTVTTNSKGEASLTVSGLNTKATPVVFLDDSVSNRVSGDNRLEATELQAKADQLVIGAVQSSYVIEVARDGKEEAATGYANGREYNVTVKTKDGKVAANETVNVSFNEVLDRNMNTKTSAVFTKDEVQDKDATNEGQQLSVKLNAKGEGSFTIAVPDAEKYEKEYATPVVWIDINSSNAKSGTLDEGEPSKVADITYFAKSELTDGVVKAYDAAGAAGKVVKEDKDFAGDKSAFFKFTAANQSGNEMTLPSGYDRIEASFTVWNTGSYDVKVDGEVVSPNRSTTVTVKNSTTPTIEVVSVDNKTTSVRVEARGTAEPTTNRNNRLQSINLGSHTAKASFLSTKDIGVIHTGLVEKIDSVKQDIYFVGKDKMSYKGASFKNINAVSLTESEFVKLVEANLGKIKITVKKDGDKVTFEIVSLDGNVAGGLNDINSANNLTAMVAALAKHGDSFSPKFSTLKNDAQKEAIAKALLDAKATTGVLSETQASAIYSMAFDGQVTKAVSDFKTTKNAANLKLVPGLDLTGVTASNEVDVLAKLATFNGSTLESLQTAVKTALGTLATDEKLKDVIGAVDSAALLEALKKVEGVDLTAFDKLTNKRQQGLVLDALLAKKADLINVVKVNVELDKEIKVVANNTTAAITSIELDGVTLSITFADASLNNAATVENLNLAFDKSATVTSSTAEVKTTAGKSELVITLGSGSTVQAGVNLTAISLTDQYGQAVDLSVVDKDGKSVHSVTVVDKTPVVVPAPAAPTGLSATAETVAGASDGKISGVTDLMEYKLSTDSTYTSVVSGETELTGLAAGTYNVRVKAVSSTNTPAGTDAAVTVTTL